MEVDTIFRIASMTKPLTSLGAMMLAEEGLIGLDDDVATHIPSWKNLGVYASGVPSTYRAIASDPGRSSAACQPVQNSQIG